MKIDPILLPEFRDWMRAKLESAAPPSAVADLAEVRAFIQMMKTAQWPIIADVADRAESDVVDEVRFDEDELLELDDYEKPFYEEFLRSRQNRG